MRIILIFLSATLACFLAWNTMSSSKDAEFQDEDKTNEEISSIKPSYFTMKMTSEKFAKFFWMMVDMASGKYLWRNLVENRNGLRVQTS
ncbi:hypothetical protein SUGI_0011040 [Cryptomeria japonica]|nr:hypothetical protein SUGI_0011040 [Cryptomeria japonica]